MIYPLLLLIADFVALVAAFTLAYILRVQVDSSPLVREISAESFIQVFLLLVPFWLLIHGIIGLYTKPVYEKRFPELGKLFVGTFLGILVIIGFDFIAEETIFPARIVPVYAGILGFLLLAATRNALWIFRRYMFRYGYGVRNVMVIGSTDATKKLSDVLKNTLSSGYTIKAVVGNKTVLPDDFEGEQFVSLEKAIEALPELGIHTVIQTEMYDSEAKNQKIFEAVRDNHLSFKFIPSQSEFYTGKNRVEVLFGFPVISVHQTPLIGWGRVVKRLFDIFASTAAIIVFSPLIVGIALLQKIREPKAPIIYKHRRMTRFGTEFNTLKFRSMIWKYSDGPNRTYKNAAQALTAMGHVDLIPEFEKNQKLTNDPRISKLGGFLRKSSLDELPQLFNVLRGELSLVGPRAMTKKEVQLYRTKAKGDAVLSVKAGVTGLWQVSGRSDVSFDERIDLDLYYVRNWSFLMDIRILFKTVYVVLKREGAE